MKKLLSVVLVLAMILGSFSMVFASDFSDVKDSDVNSEAISVLSGLGVIGGYADGTFRPEGVVTRAEMATMIVNALGIPVKGGAATQFSDVPASHWASGYINYAASVGFIAGYTDGTFQPEKQVSYNEAIAMIVASLGYKASMLPGTYPGSFINKATSLGILDVCKTTGTIGANRADIAQMLYGAADCAIGYVNNEGEFKENEGKTAGAADTMFARLGCTAYDNNSGNPDYAFVVTGDEDSDINLKPYIGAYVTAVQNKDKEIIAIAEVIGELMTFDCEMDGTTQKMGDYKVKTSGVYGETPDNGFYTFANASASAISAAALETAVGNACTNEDTVTVAAKVSGNYITKIYSIATWTPSATGVIDEDDLDDIADDQKLFTYNFKTTNKDEIDTDEFAIVGAASVADIKEDDVVYVYAKGTDIVRVEVCSDVITGKVSKIKGTGAAAKYTVAGTEYKFAAEASATRPGTGDEIEAKLAPNGKIYEYDLVKGDKNYAVVLNVGQDEGRYSGDNTTYVKMFLADGTEKEYVVDSGLYANPAAVTAAGIDSGKLVEYTLNSKGKVDGMTTAAAIGHATTINAKGLMENKLITKDSVIFTFDGVDNTKADSYAVVAMSTVLESEPTGCDWIFDDGDVKAAILTGVSTTNSIPAIFTSFASIDDDDYNYLVTFMYDGKADVEFKTDKTAGNFTATTSASGIVYKLTLDAKGGVDGITTSAIVANQHDVTPTTKTAISGSTLTVDTATKWSLADDIVVYVYDASEDEWTVGTAKSLAGKAADFDKIYLYDDDDDTDMVYDFAVVFKK